MARKTLIQVRRDTAANWTSTNPTLSAGEVGLETDTGKFKTGDGSTAWTSLTYGVTDAKLTVTDVTTNNSTTSAHGFLKKLDNNSAHFMDGQGNWTTPTGTAPGVAADTIWDTKGDLAAATGADTASKLAAGSNGKMLVTASGESTGLKWETGYLGGLELVYKYTVAGSDKASIDTGADTADAGTNDWTNADVLEVLALTRTDDAGAVPSLDVILNNDTSSIYDLQNIQGNNSTAAASRVGSDAKWRLFTHGSGGTASYAGYLSLQMPNFTGTTFFKVGSVNIGVNDTTAGNNFSDLYVVGYRSTSAITRLKLAAVSTAKLKVGSQLVIYKRRNA